MEKLLNKVNRVWDTLPKDVMALRVRPSNNMLTKEESVPINGLAGNYYADVSAKTTMSIDNTVLWNGYPTIKTDVLINSAGGGVINGRSFPVEQGKKYTASVYVKGTTNNEIMSVKMTWYDKNNVWFVSDSTQSIPVSNTEFTRLTVITTPPAGAYYGRMKIQATDINRATTWWQAGLMLQQSNGATEFEFGSVTKRSKLTVDNDQLVLHDMQYQEGLPIKDSVALDDFTLDELLEQLENLGYRGFMTSEVENYSGLKAFRLMEGTNLALKTPSKNLFGGGVSNTSSSNNSLYSTSNINRAIVDIAHASKTSMQWTLTGLTGNRGGFLLDKPSVTAGKKYTASFYAKKVSGNPPIRMHIEWKKSDGTAISNVPSGNHYALTDEWYRFVATGTAPAEASYAVITSYTNNTTAVGDSWLINGFQFEEGSEATEWVSGDTYMPVELSIFTSPLWEMLYPIARLLRNADNDTSKALEQLRLPNAQGRWLDYWASFFDLKRILGESDRSFSKRIFGRLANMKTNNIAIEDLLSYSLDVDVKVNDASASTFEVLVDPVYMDSVTYIKELIKEVRGAGIDYFVNYFKVYSEDYKSYFKDRNGFDFVDSDVNSGDVTFPTYEEFSFMYDPTSGFELNNDILTGFGSYTNLLSENYSSFESLTGTNLELTNGVTTSLDTTEKVYGNSSLKAVANGVYANQQVALANITLQPNTTYTLQFMVKGDAGKNLKYFLSTFDVNNTFLAYLGTATKTLTADWTKYIITFTTPANTAKARFITTTEGNSAQTWYLDGLQLQTGDSADEWILGGTTYNFTSEDLYGIRVQDIVTITFEETVTNLLTANQSNIETDASGLITNSGITTLTRDTSEAWEGTASLKVVTGGSTSSEGMATNPHTPIITGQTYTASVYVKGSGTVHIELAERDNTGTIVTNGTTVGANITLTNEWQRLSITRTCNTGTYINLKVVTGTAQAVTFWVDGLQIEQSDRAKTWIVGSFTGNLLTSNQSSVETDTSGLSGRSATVTRDTSEAWEGTASVKVVTKGTTTPEGLRQSGFIDVNPSTTYTFSAYVKGSGVIRAELLEFNSTDSYLRATSSTAVTLNSSWQRITVTSTVGADCVNVYCDISTNSIQAITFWVDGQQLELGSVVSPWKVGSIIKTNVIARQETL